MLLRTTLSLRPNVVIVGTGWAGCYAAHRLKPSICNIQVLSTRNHMVFTPLLAHTTTGTLEFRSVCEPIMNIQPALVNLPHRFYRCMVYDVDFDEKVVKCVGVGVPGATEKLPVHVFNVQYDYLLLAHGSRPNTFNIPGVTDKAFFLREVNEARGIRKRLVQNIMAADLPTVPVEETKRLLHTVVVGGGPTGIEFATSLAEFFRKDIARVSRSLQQHCKVTVLEANEVLGTFDQALRNYGQRRLAELGVNVVNTAVVSVTERGVVTTGGEVLEAGLVVWSTGVGPTMLTQILECDKTSQERISVDENLRILRDGKPIPNVFAAGDSAANAKEPLPTLAAVARRQGTYLGEQLNHLITKGTMTKSFEYQSLGSMVSLGDASAIVSLGSKRKLGFRGLKALWFWKSAYLTMIGSLRSKLYVFVNWCGSHIFSRDITYIGDLSEDRLYKILAGHEVSRAKNRPKATEALKMMTPTQTFTSELLEDSVEQGFISREDKTQTVHAPQEDIKSKNA
ncbi:unnamed protein product [Phytomonas sp. EM1]|nr:unnamed protein product [Phytomonas sp. EM1]|eukprot:CCW63333.1 unnamed protein product [Phytomonas sp. isolate EM1]